MEMLTRRQLAVLAPLALLFWLAAIASLRIDPGAVRPGLRGDLGFLFSLPMAWLCVLLARWLARLRPEQILVGTAFVVAVDTGLDACALRWVPAFPATGADFRVLAAAWLLWGYGASLAAALIMGRANRLEAGGAIAGAES